MDISTCTTPDRHVQHAATSSLVSTPSNRVMRGCQENWNEPATPPGSRQRYVDSSSQASTPSPAGGRVPSMDINATPSPARRISCAANPSPVSTPAQQKIGGCQINWDLPETPPDARQAYVDSSEASTPSRSVRPHCRQRHGGASLTVSTPPSPASNLPMYRKVYCGGWINAARTITA